MLLRVREAVRGGLATEEFLPAFVDEGVFGAALLAGEVSEALVAAGDGVEVAEGFVAVGGVFDAAFGLGGVLFEEVGFSEGVGDFGLGAKVGGEVGEGEGFV